MLGRVLARRARAARQGVAVGTIGRGIAPKDLKARGSISDFISREILCEILF